ncbi:MAG: hypothetical protein FJ318_08285 [SAR202 cluster bacterium]|nr:hypothetical protein [SAR202 cluster bacterium]
MKIDDAAITPAHVSRPSYSRRVEQAGGSLDGAEPPRQMKAIRDVLVLYFRRDDWLAARDHPPLGGGATAGLHGGGDRSPRDWRFSR